MVSAQLTRTHATREGDPRPARVSPVIRCLLGGLLCGTLLALSIPPFGFWPLAWLGFAGLALLLPGRPPAMRALLGLSVGLAQYAIGLVWVSEFSIPGEIVLVIVSGLFVSAAVVLVPSRRWAHLVVGLPAAFVVSDWLRARFPLGGFPLGGVSLGQSLSPEVPAARLGGGLLLTAETVLIGVLLAQLARTFMSWRQSASSGRIRPQAKAREAARTVAIAAVCVAFPLAGWLSPNGSGGQLRGLRIALVQGGGPRGTRAIHTDPEVVFQRHLAAAAAIRPPVDLVVMPEGILQTDQTFTTTSDGIQVAALAQTLNSTVIVGVEQDVGTKRYLNEVAAWSPAGSVVAVYLKNHRVPFGEYVPWRSLISRYFNVSDVPLDAIAGHGPGYMRTPAAPVGVMISYEVFFDERARGGVRAGGQVLVVPTNTASYRSSQVPTQELAAARLRAWETGRWVLQVTPTGYTAVLSPNGKVIARSELGKESVIEATVERETGRTVYVDIGDSPLAIAAAMLLVGSLLLARSRRSGARRSGPPAPRPRSPDAAPLGGPKQELGSILLVCTGNQCRSPMAAALLEGMLEQRGFTARVESAGFISEGSSCPPEVDQVMSELGYDLSGHRSRVVSESMLNRVDVVIGMTRQHVLDLSVMAPHTWRRTFTIVEVTKLGQLAGPRRPNERLPAWVRRAGRPRTRSGLLSLSLSDDISDPIGKPLSAYIDSRERLVVLCSELAELLAPV